MSRTLGPFLCVPEFQQVSTKKKNHKVVAVKKAEHFRCIICRAHVDAALEKCNVCGFHLQSPSFSDVDAYHAWISQIVEPMRQQWRQRKQLQEEEARLSKLRQEAEAAKLEAAELLRQAEEIKKQANAMMQKAREESAALLEQAKKDAAEILRQAEKTPPPTSQQTTSSHSSASANLTAVQLFELAKERDAQKDAQGAFLTYQAAAQKGNVSSQYVLAQRYRNGIGTSVDRKKAFYWMSRAAENLHRDAMFHLGAYYEQGIGTEPDLKQALRWYQDARARGHTAAAAAIARLPHPSAASSNRQTKSSDHTASQTSQNHSPHSSTPSVAQMYQRGKALDAQKKWPDAFHCYKMAAENGHVESQYLLAQRLAMGVGTDKNTPEAFRWMFRAADNNNLNAIFELGTFYEKGIGVTTSLKQALRCYKNAAEHGFEAAKQAVKRLHPQNPFEIAGNTLVRYHGVDATVELPDSVSVIGSSAFQNCTTVESVYAPSVTQVNDHAFHGCEDLRSITLSSGENSSPTKIGDYAFQDCLCLSSIHLPLCVSSIGAFAFENCVSLKTVDIPHQVRTIGESAFENCISLTAIDLPSSVRSIGSRAFFQCRSLKSVIKKSYTVCGKDAFGATPYQTGQVPQNPSKNTEHCKFCGGDLFASGRCKRCGRYGRHL